MHANGSRVCVLYGRNISGAEAPALAWLDVLLIDCRGIPSPDYITWELCDLEVRQSLLDDLVLHYLPQSLKFLSINNTVVIF